MQIGFKPLHPDFKLPEKATEHAACYDVVATEIEYISDSFVICKLGFALELPTDIKVVLVPRSNLTEYSWTMVNSPGQGEADYVLEYQVRFRAIPVITPYMETSGRITTLQKEISYEPFPYKVGNRVAQIYFDKVLDIKPVIIEQIQDKGTRKGGFGSTGL